MLKTSFFHAFAFVYLSLALAVVSLSACTKIVTDESVETRELAAILKTATGAWNVNGIKLGQSLSDVEAKRGKANKPEIVTVPVVHVWPDSVMVEADANNRVSLVFGNTLHIGETAVTRNGLTATQTEQLLGSGNKRVFRSPRGSGVISTGWVVTGASLTYARDGAFFTFGFDKNDRLTSVVQRLDDPNKKR